MRNDHSVVGRQAFGPDADALVTLKYKSYSDASRKLREAIKEGSSFSLLYGPESSGKTVIVRELFRRLQQKSTVVSVDGAALTDQKIASTILAGLGCTINLNSLREILNLIHVIAIHQVRTGSAPILFVENIDRMSPSALQLLCALAELSTHDQPALRLVLTGRQQSLAVLASQEMTSIASRTGCVVGLGPLTTRESVNYLYSRLSRSGVPQPDGIFPLDVCERLHELSGGWPGLLNGSAIKAIERVKKFPVRVSDTIERRKKEFNEKAAVRDVPADTDAGAFTAKIIVSRSGKMVSQYTLGDKNVLVGRSKLADVRIDDDFVSKFHAMLLNRSNTLFIIDLNSSNGTMVNSRKVDSIALKNADIISLGHYRIKIEKHPIVGDEAIASLESSETARMKTLDDQRAARLVESTLANVENKKKA